MYIYTEIDTLDTEASESECGHPGGPRCVIIVMAGFDYRIRGRS